MSIPPTSYLTVGIAADFTHKAAVLGVERVLCDYAVALYRLARADAVLVIGERYVQPCFRVLRMDQLAATGPGELCPVMPAEGVPG